MDIVPRTLLLIVALGVFSAFDAMATDLDLPALATSAALSEQTPRTMQTSPAVFVGGAAIEHLSEEE